MMFVRQIALLLTVLFLGSLSSAAQKNISRYEAELLSNPNKERRDTREINAVLIFEDDALRIVSRRDRRVFKEFKYTELKMVEHSFSKSPVFSDLSRSAILAAIIAPPLWYEKKEKHWLNLLGESDFAVIKIENDNYRLIKMEFLVRELDIVNVNEDRQ